MKKLLRKILFGEIPVREYATVTVAGDIIERVWLEAGSKRIDISMNHWLLCLEPVVFGIWLTKRADIGYFDKRLAYHIYFKDSEKNAETVAVLELNLFHKIEEPDGTLLLLKLTKATSYHINFIKTRLLFYKHYKKPEQDLKKLRSYAAAYSFPRRVRLISFKEGDYFNIFPMDLVGDIPFSKRFVFGLRHSNVTLARIIETKKMAVSEIPFEYKDIIYQLGKHHRGPVSSAMPPLIESESFGFPIPAWANSYKEIQIVKTMNLGSHMLLWGEEIHERKLTEPTGHLFHVHFLHYLHQKKKGLDYPLV
jgi:hypothetical protein